jgi:hypothetical protein
VLGFLPEDSLVLLTTGGSGEPFHARIDLPDGPDDLPLVVDPLVLAAVRNGATQGAVVVYSHDAVLAELAHDLLRAELDAVGVRTVVALRADGARHYPVDDLLDPGTPYDLARHPLTACAVFDGRVTYASRRELSDSLQPVDRAALDRVGRLLAAGAHRVPGPGSPPLGRPTPEQLRAKLVAEGRWARDRVRSSVSSGSGLDDEQLARLLGGLVSVELRDVLWAEITRSTARAHVTFWSDVVRRTPDDAVAPPAALLAFAAWLAGEGALAWCAVDRCRAADPSYSMAGLVASALEAALPPSTWKPVDPASLTLFTR